MGDDVENIDLLVLRQHPRHFPGGRLRAGKHAHGYLRSHAPQQDTEIRNGRIHERELAPLQPKPRLGR